MQKQFTSLTPAAFVLPAVMAFSLALYGCQTTQGEARPDSSAKADGTQVAASAAPADAMPKISGPKRTISVGKFDAIGAFTAKYGNWDIGGGLSAMMTTALIESGQFIVVERANLQQVLSEQELKASRLANPNTGPTQGKIIGVQHLVYGSVTEFGAEDKGGGFSVGGAGGGIGNLISGALSTQSASGNVTIDVRLVDTTTGQVIETHTINQPIESSGFDVSLGYRGINMGTNQFDKTPLGVASRAVISRAVRRIASDVRGTPWTGRVVEFDGDHLYINAGARAGIKNGDKFMIERVVKRLTDPTTSEVLSIRKKPLGVLQVTGVENKISYGTFQPLEMEPPQRGDLVAIMY